MDAQATRHVASEREGRSVLGFMVVEEGAGVAIESRTGRASGPFPDRRRVVPCAEFVSLCKGDR